MAGYLRSLPNMNNALLRIQARKHLDAMTKEHLSMTSIGGLFVDASRVPSPRHKAVDRDLPIISRRNDADPTDEVNDERAGAGDKQPSPNPVRLSVVSS